MAPWDEATDAQIDCVWTYSREKLQCTSQLYVWYGSYDILDIDWKLKMLNINFLFAADWNNNVTTEYAADIAVISKHKYHLKNDFDYLSLFFSLSLFLWPEGSELTIFQLNSRSACLAGFSLFVIQMQRATEWWILEYKRKWVDQKIWSDPSGCYTSIV
jgi:hypothetical protein